MHYALIIAIVLNSLQLLELLELQKVESPAKLKLIIGLKALS